MGRNLIVIVIGVALIVALLCIGAVVLPALGGKDTARLPTVTSATRTADARSTAPSTAETPLTTTPGTVRVDQFYVEPGDGLGPVLREIDGAKFSIDLVVYLLTSGRVESALINAHRRGVNVRVMVEENPYGGGAGNGEAVRKLEKAGISVKYGNPTYRYTHEKAMVIDGTRALVMSSNLTTSAFTRNREYLALIFSAPEVREIDTIFNADWNRTRYVPHVPSLVVSDVNSRDKLLGLINSARHSLDVETEVLQDDEIQQALERAHERGVTIHIVMSPPSPGDPSDQTLSALTKDGVGVHLLKNPYVHAKAMLVDDSVAYIGSVNFTATSMDQNRELGLLTATPEVLDALRRTMDADWRKAAPYHQGK